MAADELTKALLVEEVAPPRAIAEALFQSVTGRVPLVQALLDSGAASSDVLSRYLAREPTPFLRHVVAVPELVARLPAGLPARLLAVPVRLDSITGTVDVVVADPADPHPAAEIAFHLGATVRLVRAPVAAIEEAIRRLRNNARRPMTLPPPEPALSISMPLERDVAPRASLVIEPDSAPPARIRTPPWGTPVHVSQTDHPSSYGSEIPLPLTRRTFFPSKISGGTQRPPNMFDPSVSALGEGYAVDVAGYRDVVERSQLQGSFIPGPPPLPASMTPMSAPHVTTGSIRPSAFAPQLPFTDLGGVLTALKNAGSRDEILELLLTGARAVALKVALFVVKKGGYLGWMCTPEFAERSQLQTVLVSLEANSVFDRAVREDIYLGPIRYDEVHAPLLRIMRNPTRDVALVPVRVSGRTAVVIVADELGDTMIGTRRLEELGRAAGEAFARIVRTRR